MNYWKKILLVCLIAIAFLFGYSRTYCETDIPIDSEIFSHYGDFIGGILSIVSIYLITETLKEQKKSSKSSLRTQRKIANESYINNLFFELLKYLQTEISDLNISTKNDAQYTNKDFFEELKRELHKIPTKESYKRNRDAARKQYLEIYSKNLRIGAYFRILYRICDLIDNSVLEEQKKRDYIKIVRSQLTNAELLLIRYNAMLPDGERFQKYISKYNILKHLTIGELLEFSHYSVLLTEHQDMYDLNQLYLKLRSKIRDISKKSVREDMIDFEKWTCTITYATESEIIIRFEKKGTQSRKSDFRLLNRLNFITLKKLIRDLLQDMFIYREYESNYTNRTLLIREEKSETDKSVVYIVQSRDGSSIKIA